MRLRLTSFVAAATLFYLFTFLHARPIAYAANGIGDLDPSFGVGGKVTALFFGGSASAAAGVLQPDGKIIAAGGTGPTSGFALARFNTDGNLDLSFGQAGKVWTPFQPVNDSNFVRGVALQPDQKIVAAGFANNTSGVREFAVVRYLPDGQLDLTFGSAGKVTTAISGNGDDAYALVIQPDGRIVLAGSVSGQSEEFGLVRYNSDGTLDSTFGSAGEVTLEFDHFGDAAQALALQSDGKIVVAGRATQHSPPFDFQRFGIARYNPDGTLDSSFGSAGKVMTALTDNKFDRAQATSVVIQPDAKIVVGGWSDGPLNGTDFAVARYNTDGSLDPTLGTAGHILTDFSNGGNEQILGLALQPDNKIIAAGFTDRRGDGEVFALARYNCDGSLDNSFGTSGKLTTQFFFEGAECDASAVVLQPNGNIIAIGGALATDGGHMTLARYIG